MVKHRIRKGILPLILAAAILSALAGMTALTLPYISAETTAVPAALGEFYHLNDVLTVPDATLGEGETQVPAESFVLRFPSGKCSEAERVLLSEPGEYTLTYRAASGGKRLTAKKTFVVRGELYSCASPKSSAYYGKHPQVAKDKQGIVVSLSRGDVFRYNRIIDFTNLRRTDNLLELIVIPQYAGTADATEITVRFTDVYDGKNYVDVALRDLSNLGTWANGMTYAVSAAAGRPLSGMENGALHQGNEYGTPFKYSLVGLPAAGTGIGSEVFGLSFDYKQKQVFGANPVYHNGNLIVDLDDSNVFTDPWQGFSTGKARMSIFAKNYQTSSLNFILPNINGESLSENSRIDGTAPELTVDYGEYSEEAVPKGVVGKPYPVFGCRAYDTDDGDLRVYTNVYRNYGREDETVCQVRNGAFIPKTDEEYTVVYYAADRFGNAATETVSVTVSESDRFAIEVRNPASSGRAGEQVKAFEDIEASHASGNFSAKITAVRKEGGASYEIDPETYDFCPLYAGEYEITVSARDYVSEAEQKFSIRIDPGTSAQIFGEASFPKYLIKGCTYTLPELTGYAFSSGEPVPAEISVSVIEDGKPAALVEGRYIVGASFDVVVVYTAGEGADAAVKQYRIPVVAVGYGETLDLPAYFHTVSGTFEKQVTESDLSCTSSEDGSSMEFINPLLVRPFSFLFRVDAVKNHLTGINVYLTDSVNAGQSVKFSFERTETASTFRINGGIRYACDAVFGESSYNFAVGYDASTRRAGAGGSLSVPVTSYENKKPFEGFESNKVTLRIELTGVTGEACLRILNLNKQGFFDLTEDVFAPQISVNSAQGDRAHSEEILIRATYALDVLDPDVRFEMLVTAPDGSVVTASDGTVLDETCDPTRDYLVKLTQYGEYSIGYRAEDTSGAISRYSYGVSVVDSEKPVITLTGKVTEGKVGKSVKLAECTVTDNLSQTVKVIVFVESPDGKIDKADGNSFTPSKRGIYTVRYSAYDEKGNFRTASYQIEVE